MTTQNQPTQTAAPKPQTQTQQTPQQPQLQAPAPQQQPQANKPPVDTIRDGSLKATLWERSGQHGKYFTTDFARTFKTQDGQLKDSRSFSGDELLRVAELARRAYERDRALRREAFKAQRKGSQEPQHTQEQQQAPAPDQSQ